MKGPVTSALFSAALAFTLCATPSAPLAADAIELRYANFFPPVHPVSVLSEEWGREVEKRTDGRVKVVYFHGGSLTPAQETYDSVLTGIADLGLSFCSYTRGRFPLTEVLDLPLGYESSSVATAMANAYLAEFQPGELDDVEVMYLHTSAPHKIITRDPVAGLADLEGLKIRSTGTSSKVVEALGAVPVAMPMSDAYDALKKGIAEGIIGPLEPLKGFKLIDVVDYATPLPSAYVNTAYVVMNKDRWNSLPPEVQATIREINREWIVRQGALWDRLEEDARKALLDSGGKVVDLPAEEKARWAARLEPIVEEFVQEKGAQGLPAREAVTFCREYLAQH